MVFVYGMADGVIDTLQWEGFREGVDDIRYATLLHGLAVKAAASTNLDTIYAGAEALQWFRAVRQGQRGPLHRAS